MFKSVSLFSWLLWLELRVFFQSFFANLIDALMWPAAVVLVNSFVMPLMGISTDYGSFILVSIAASMCLFNAINKAQVLVSDMENVKNISYQLTLPLKSWLLFIKVGLGYALTSIFLNMLTVPIGALLFQNLFNFGSMDLMKTILIFISINIFFGFYGLCIASWVKNASSFPHVWMRFVLPLWMLGGYQYSWMILHKGYPLISYLSLLNPMIYAFEGLRAATLGQEGFINFWICLAMLWFATAVCYLLSLRKFKQRLDYV